MANIVFSIGTATFRENMQAFLEDECGADHFAVFAFHKDGLSTIETDPTSEAQRNASLYQRQEHWRNDPYLSEARSRALHGESAMISTDMALYPDNLRRLVYPRVAGRVVIALQLGARSYGLSVLRSEGHRVMSDHQLRTLSVASPILVAAARSHAETLKQTDMSQALSSLPAIEETLSFVGGITRRELQVVARTLWGVSTAGIAAELGIGEESVKTYRKRLYRRVGLIDGHELTSWYLRHWGNRPREFGTLGRM